MADSQAPSAVKAETEKSSTVAAVESTPQNENKVSGDSAPESAKDTASAPTTGEAASDAQDKPADVTNGPSSERKRKHSPANDRDWRERRDADNRRDRGGQRGRGGNRGGNGQRGGFSKKDYSANVRTDFTALPESSDPEEIRKQVEFYFSDSNLPTDKFLLTQVGGPDNKAVPVKVIHSFKRMRHFQPYSAVVAALKESTTLNIIGADGSEEIQRKSPLPENVSADDPHVNVTLFEDATRTRSIYAKGFGEEVSSTQFDIESFFAPYGPINAVRLRRFFPEKDFKGSVFVEFDSTETQQQFLELENKPKWQGKDLKIMSKEEYVTSKVKDIKAGKVRSNRADEGARAGRGGSSRGGVRGRGNGRGGRGNGRGHGRDRDGGDRDRRNGSRDVAKDGSQSGSPERTTKKETGNDDPVVKPEPTSAPPATVTASNGAAEAPTESKKRGRDEADAGNDGDAELKRAKVENAAEAGA